MNARLLLVLPVIALLAACTTGGAAPDGGTGGGTGGDGGSSGGGGNCSGFGAEYAPFSSDLVASQSGTTWGDGTAFELQLSDEAIEAGLLPTLEFLSIVNGPPQVASGQVMEDLGDGKFSNNLNLFDSQFDGQPGIARVIALADLTFDGEKYDGDKLILGNYCLTLEVAE